MFSSYAAQHAGPVKDMNIMARLWTRNGGAYSSGNSDQQFTFWLVGSSLFRAKKSNASLQECGLVAELEEKTQNGNIPFLIGKLDNCEVQVRVNTLEQKQSRVDRAILAGKDASIEKQPTLYIMSFTEADTSEPAETLDMPF